MKRLLLLLAIILLAFITLLNPTKAWEIPATTESSTLGNGVYGSYYFFDDRIELKTDLILSDPDLYDWVYAHELGHAFFRDISFAVYYGKPIYASVFPVCNSWVTARARDGDIAEDAAETFTYYIMHRDAFANFIIKNHNSCLAKKYLAVKKRLEEVVNKK